MSLRHSRECGNLYAKNLLCKNSHQCIEDEWLWIPDQVGDDTFFVAARNYEITCLKYRIFKWLKRVNLIK